MEGLATSFVTGDDVDILYDLKQTLTATGNFVPQELRDHPAAQFKAAGPTDKPATTRRETVIYTN